MKNTAKKIALERIYRLFELALEKPLMSKRYLTLAKTIGEKTNVRIPPELKNQYCKKCYSTTITSTTQEETITITCKTCGYIRKSRKA